MLYEKVTKRCSAVRMSKEEAEASLLHQFPGSEVLDLNRRGDKWAATLLMPHNAEFPPSDEGGDDSGEESKPKEKDSEGSSEGGSSEGPPKADKSPSGEEGPEGHGGPGGGIEHAVAELTSLVHMIADSMGILPPPAVPGADDMGMGGGMGGPPAPPHGPPMGPEGGGGGHIQPGGGPQEIVHKTKLRPGETPPGVTPIGSPAFSSVQSSQLQRMASFDAFDDTPHKTIKEAKDELEAIYGPYGFKVRQIKRVENGRRLAAKLSRR